MQNKWIPFLILGLALLHGLIYVFLIPPWQHYDEPNHFEYVWLVANAPGLPEEETRHPALARMVLESMIINGFYAHTDYKPDLALPDSKIRIEGYSQLDEPPLYYLWTSIPLFFLQPDEVELQLYAARLASLALLLVTVLSAWGAAKELTMEGSPLRWMVPLTIALLPGFVDLMTAVNNDVGAVAVASLFFWGAARILQRGFSLFNAAWILLTAAMAFFTKTTAYLVIPLAGLALILSLTPVRLRKWIWAAGVAGVIAFAAVAVSWGGASSWFLNSDQEQSSRARRPEAPLGQYALHLDAAAGARNVRLQQLVPVDLIPGLLGKTITAGAWIWADRPVEGQILVLQAFGPNRSAYSYSEEISVSNTPKFYALRTTLKDEIYRMWINLTPGSRQVEEGLNLYFDGVVLAEGEYDLQATPVFDGDGGQSGKWSGRPFVNLLRNPSAEQAWPWFRPWVDRISRHFFTDYGNDRPSTAFSTVLDLRGAGWYYRVASASLLETFWARFSWGQIPILGAYSYPILIGVTILGMIGAALGLLWHTGRLPWDAVIFFGLGIFLIWGLALFRGSNYVLLTTEVYIPVARYGYPAIIPTALLLAGGWEAVFALIERKFRAPTWLKAAVVGLFLIGLDFWSIYSIMQFYS